MNTAFDRIVDALSGHGSNMREHGGRVMAQCPAHEDRNPSLSVSGIEGQVLLHCFAGCDNDDVLAALSLARRDMFDDPKNGVAYRYDDGRIVNRSPEKRFFQKGNTQGKPQLYRLAKLIAAPMDAPIYLVEGEKDVHAVESAGGVATCNPMGSVNFGKVDVEPLRNRSVVVVVDKDDAGAKWGADVRHRLVGIVKAIRFVQAAEGKDASDHIAASELGQELEGWLPYAIPVDPAAHEEEPEGRFLPAPADPMAVARVLVETDIPREDDEPTWAWWRGDFYQWEGTRWDVLPESTVEQWAYRSTETALYEDVDRKGNPIIARWAPTTTKVRNLIHALSRGVVQRDHDLESEDAAEFVACTNGVIVLGTRVLAGHTPARFNLHSLPFAYDPGAECPDWLTFLSQILPGEDEQDAVLFLQEWFGYVVSGRTDIHKIASLIGDKRCGKGTIARVLVAMVGERFVTGPKLGQMAGTFGLEPFIGKRLAVMGDVRWNQRNASDAVEVLLGISGGDHGTVHRKNRTAWEGTLGVRFLMMSNDEPKFSDASGAMASRMIHVAFRQSFYGREDPGLTDRLLRELPGILNWALAGLDRLCLNGRFTVPRSSVEVNESVQRTAAPVQAFLSDRCVHEEGVTVSLTELFAEWKQWSEKSGRPDDLLNEDMFSAAVRSATRSLKPAVATRRKMVKGERTTWFGSLRLRLPSDPDEAGDVGVPEVASAPRWLVSGAQVR